MYHRKRAGSTPFYPRVQLSDDDPRRIERDADAVHAVRRGKELPGYGDAHDAADPSGSCVSVWLAVTTVGGWNHLKRSDQRAARHARTRPMCGPDGFRAGFGRVASPATPASRNRRRIAGGSDTASARTNPRGGPFPSPPPVRTIQHDLRPPYDLRRLSRARATNRASSCRCVAVSATTIPPSHARRIFRRWQSSTAAGCGRLPPVDCIPPSFGYLLQRISSPVAAHVVAEGAPHESRPQVG
jgi:hypothetical protein